LCPPFKDRSSVPGVSGPGRSLNIPATYNTYNTYNEGSPAVFRTESKTRGPGAANLCAVSWRIV